MEINKILQGDCLAVLKTLPDESIDCVMTSPPYWALRAYQTNPQIWDGDNNCCHIWEEIDALRKATPGDKPSKNSKVAINRSNNENRPGKPSDFCIRCGAWRGEFGLEPTFELYVKHLCDIFDEIKRVLRGGGTCWVNIGDTYHNATKWTYQDGSQTIAGGNPRDLATGRKVNQGLPEKCLCQIPSRFAIEMTNRGWILRNEIIWHKPNCMPASVKDRFTVDFEKIFFFVKNKKYFFETQFEPYVENSDMAYRKKLRCGRKYGVKRPYEDNQPLSHINTPAIVNPLGRNKRCVWKVTTKPFREAHFATYPEALCETPIKAGCPEGGIVLDPFFGAGTTGVVARKLKRNFIGIELNPDYIKIAEKRLAGLQIALL